MLILDLFLWLIAITLLVPVATFCAEVLAGYRTTDASPVPPATDDFIILMPAHNEEAVLDDTLAGLVPTLQRPSQLWLIADNCSDRTAAIGRGYGVTVLERSNIHKRGKGYALDFGMRQIAAGLRIPAVVIIFDADCQVAKGSLAQLAGSALKAHRPVQAAYLMHPPAGPSLKQRVASFAFTVKNKVRLTGGRKLGIPCLLTGSGMAFPYAQLKNSPLASGNIVEDMQLGVDLTLSGTAPIFEPSVVVDSVFPEDDGAGQTQRTRWEHGHLQTIRQQVPRLFRAALQQKRSDLAKLALDLAVPPLTLLLMLTVAGWLLTGAGALVGASVMPFVLLTTSGLVMATSILLAWRYHGKAVLPAENMLAIPAYMLGKVSVYTRFLTRPQTVWQRTDKSRRS